MWTIINNGYVKRAFFLSHPSVMWTGLRFRKLGYGRVDDI